MTISLCVLALAVFSPDLKPLPEERKLEGAEQIVFELARLEAPQVGDIGWTKTMVQRAELEGAAHYLVLQTAELLDFEALGFVAMESRGLYDSDLRLVHESRLAQPFGMKAKTLELEWADEGFRWREGRGKWSEAVAAVRPTVKTDIALMIRGLDLQVPFEAHVFEENTKTLEARTVKAAKETEVDGEVMMDFEVDGAPAIRHRLTKKGVYMDSKVGDLRVVGVDAEERTERTLGRRVADNETFASALGKALPTQWTEKRGTLEHEMLGLSLKLPKGWTRANETEVEGVALRAFSPDANAYVNLSVSVQGTGYTLDGWEDGLIEYYAPSAIDGKVTSKKTKFARHDAIRFEFTSSGASLEMVAYAWSHNGMGVVLIGGAAVSSPKKLHRDAQSVFKSVKY